MSQDRTAERQTFVTAIENLAKTGLSLLLSDVVTCGDDVFHVQVDGNGKSVCTVSAFNESGDNSSAMVLPSGTVTDGAVGVWQHLEMQRLHRIARIIDPTSTCDGGLTPCIARAVWAFKINPEDGWMYACGRHLTASMTEETAGEQAEFTVRRIVTEGC